MNFKATLCLALSGLAFTFHPQSAQAEAPPQFSFTFGHSGTNDGEFRDPVDLAVDGQGNLLVVDASNNRIQKFDSSGRFLTKFAHNFGTSEVETFWPSAVALDSAGNIYVSEAMSRVQKFDSNGVFLAMWPVGSLTDQATGIAVDRDGFVYVANRFGNSIYKFTSSGGFVSQWGNSLNQPYGLALGQNGELYVADMLNHRIQKYTTDGIFLLSWGGYGSGDGQFNQPANVCTDCDGSVFVGDRSNHRVQKFTRDGVFLGKWGESGTNSGQFGYARGVTMAAGGCRVYVSDGGNDRVQAFGYPPRLVGSSAARLPDGSFRFGVASEPGAVLEIQASSDLTSWPPLSTITNSTGSILFTDPATALSRRFYRVLQQ